jgi:hypothetical protein
MVEYAELEAVEVKIRMILSPIAALLRSRKVMVALVSLLVALIVTWVPQFASVETELITLITVVALALIGSTAWEDTAAIKAAANTNASKPADELAKEVAVIVIDELAGRGGPAPAGDTNGAG